MPTKPTRPSLARLMVEVHHLATGHAITIAEAREYFHRPELLADVVRRSGLVDDPSRRRQLQRMLATQEEEASVHGL